MTSTEPLSQMIDTYHLEPFGFGVQGLRVVNIDFNSCSDPIILGRNSLTGLDLSTVNHVQAVSRTHAEVSEMAGKIYIAAKSKQDDLVFRNGSPIPRDVPIQICCGDKICLVGPMQLFNYEVINGTVSDEDIEARYKFSLSVVMEPAATPQSSRKRKIEWRRDTIIVDSLQPIDGVESSSLSESSSSSSSSSIAVTTNAAASASVAATAAKLETHYECSICFCPMACCHSISPCGHSFCYICIADWAAKHKTCPFCLVPFQIKASLPNITIEGIIREILTMDPNPESLSCWEERAREGLDRKRGIKHTPRKKAAVVIRPISDPIIATSVSIPAAATTVPVIEQRPLRSSPARVHSQATAGVAVDKVEVNTPMFVHKSTGPVALVAVMPATVVNNSGTNGIVDLTNDDVSLSAVSSRNLSAGLLQLQTDQSLKRTVEVTYAKTERHLCTACTSQIRPSKVQICVSAPELVEKMFFHRVCMDSLVYRRMNLRYDMIIGKNLLTEKDKNILRLANT